MKELAKKIHAQFKKLRTQLFFAYFATFFLFLLIVLSIIFHVVQTMFLTQISISRLDVLKQISERANTVKTSGMTILNLYRYDTTLKELLSDTKTSEGAERTVRYLEVLKKKNDAVFEEVGIPYEMVLLGDHFLDSSQGKDYRFELLSQQLWYRRLKSDLVDKEPKEIQFVRTFRDEFSRSGGGYFFGAGSLVTVEQESFVLLLLVDEVCLQSLYEPALSAGSSIYLFDREGYIVSHPNKKMLGKQFIDAGNMRTLYGVNDSHIVEKLGKPFLLSTYEDVQTGWTMVEEIPCENIFGALYSSYRILAITLAGCLWLALTVSYEMSRRISRPLAQLSDAMDRFGCADFMRLSADTGTEEIDHLRESFNHMAGEIIALMEDIRSRSKQKRLLELSFLRAQINPHFLYNTLFSIRCMVEIHKNELAVEMLTAFTDLLKKTLSVESAEITLKEEFESTRKYLVLQKIRYGEKINFEFDLDAGTTDCFVPPLILQPVVENAIFHGLEAKKAAGTIVVESSLIENRLVITVSDDGLGIPADVLGHIRESLRQPLRKQQNSIGLANVQSRITLNHGDKCGLTIKSSPETGTMVTLMLQIRHQPPDGGEALE